jgi:glycosyltransferase involved in cell wall biosynthesis
MKLTLIITTFNWPEALSLVILSVSQQTLLPAEIIVADDGSDKRTKDLISKLSKEINLSIIHSWQEDKGFRASRSRNKAIYKSTGDYIILIDGDSILHPNFLKDHFENAEPKYFVQGSRVLLSKKQTKQTITNGLIHFNFFSSGLQNRKNAVHSKFLSNIFSNKKNSLRGIKTCNLAFYRKDCLKINGFNNDFEGWGREDSDFAVRMMNSGINRKNIRFNAIQFHMWHNESPKNLVERNNKMLDDAINNSLYWCENGIKAIVNNEG